MKKLMSYSNFNKAAILLIVLCLLIGLYTGFQRMQVEKDYKTVEISLDFEEMIKFTDSTDSDLTFWLNKFKSLGAESVTIQEETINTLIKQGYDIKTYIVSELSKSLYWEKEFPRELLNDIKTDNLSNNDSIIRVGDQKTFDYIIDGLSLRYPEEFFKVYEGEDANYIVLSGIVDDIYYGATSKIYNVFGEAITERKQVEDSRLFNIGIGYSEDKINLAKECGLDVILRPLNYARYTEKLVDAYKFENEKYGLTPRLYIVNGKEVIGYPNNTADLEEYLRDNNAMPVLIETSNQRENIEQKGLVELVTNLNYDTVRGFTMWDWIRQRYQVYGYDGAEEIENSVYRAVTERNIRFVLFKPFYEGTDKYLTDVNEYERTFNSLTKRLEPHGITLGKTNSVTDFHIGNVRLAILCLGVGLASVCLFNSVFKLHNNLGKALYILSLFSFFAPFVSRNLSEKLFALCAAIAFSGLAIFYFMTMIKKIKLSKKELSTSKMIISSTIVLLVTCLISFAGAIFIVAILSDVKYMIELDIFRGVKAAQLLPFGIYLLILLLQFINANVNVIGNDIVESKNNLRSIVNPLTKVLNANIKVYYIILGGIIAVIGYIYIARTGHETNVQPANIELMVRNFLENILIARPRTKEFLMAFPAVFAAVFAANKKIPFATEAFMLLGVIGTSSIINTFCHIRTPLYLSIDRTLISICFGIIIGCIAIIILNGIYKIFTKMQERLK